MWGDSGAAEGGRWPPHSPGLHKQPHGGPEQAQHPKAGQRWHADGERRRGTASQKRMVLFRLVILQFLLAWFCFCECVCFVGGLGGRGWGLGWEGGGVTPLLTLFVTAEVCQPKKDGVVLSCDTAVSFSLILFLWVCVFCRRAGRKGVGAGVGRWRSNASIDSLCDCRSMPAKNGWCCSVLWYCSFF